MPDGPDLNAGHRQRLRERFRKAHLEGFHDYEVLELVLTYAIPRRDVKPLAKTLIERFNGLRGVFDASVEELGEVRGVGENAAMMINLIKEVCGEYLKERMMKKDVIRSTKDVLQYLDMKLSGNKVEKFLAIYLNSKNEVMGLEVLHEGTIDQTLVYPRKVIENAFKHNARSVIFVHNHPSGDPTPSKNDRSLTEELKKVASAVDIIVHDHIIVGRNGHFSARDAGWIGEGSRV
ncbi:MAG: DNA repair protein RadC [Deltaproteobacteria bacterium]|nr:DNA repair protein RadC [Deltaproteobacteria bacterium]